MPAWQPSRLRATSASMPRGQVTFITALLQAKPIECHLRSPILYAMFSFTQFVTRTLMKVSHFFRPGTEHLETARWGEVEAYFYLRSLGYRIVARNFRTAFEHGEVDMVGWDDGALCFIEVKTHARSGLVPPEMAVDAAKRHHIRAVARRYLRKLRLDRPPACRFDVVSVVLGSANEGPVIRLHKGAFRWKAAHPSDPGAYARRQPAR